MSNEVKYLDNDCSSFKRAARAMSSANLIKVNVVVFDIISLV